MGAAAVEDNKDKTLILQIGQGGWTVGSGWGEGRAWLGGLGGPGKSSELTGWGLGGGPGGLREPGGASEEQ